MREIIRRYDEVISDKVNKIRLLQLEKHIEDAYVPHSDWNELKKNLEETQSK